MKLRLLSYCTFALLTIPALLPAQEMPKMPAPVQQHAWLQKFVGEWDSELEINMPGQPIIKGKSTEQARMLGGFWVVCEGKGEMMGMPITNVLTLGYDPEKQKYVGTWVDSMTSHLWSYQGTLDATGRILTLETEGPCPMRPGKLTQFREVTEFKSDDHRVFTSQVRGEDGSWTTPVTVSSRRKK